MAREFRYAALFIDTSDDEFFVRDETGQEYADVEDAKDAAVAALPDMARDKLPDGDSRNFLALVRGEEGATLLQASLILKVTSLVPSGSQS